MGLLQLLMMSLAALAASADLHTLATEMGMDEIASEEKLVAVSAEGAFQGAKSNCRKMGKSCWIDAQCCSARCQQNINRCRPVR
mmetsp:Transcript_100969/g.240610  ORF Transcript_100969/g.240610 Transcript_100969/m.240610 type:complete len:84 (-) Transcript_100969:137-388(-)